MNCSNTIQKHNVNGTSEMIHCSNPVAYQSGFCRFCSFLNSYKQATEEGKIIENRCNKILCGFALAVGIGVVEFILLMMKWAK
jgi:hypothetical protein